MDRYSSRGRSSARTRQRVTKGPPERPHQSCKSEYSDAPKAGTRCRLFCCDAYEPSQTQFGRGNKCCVQIHACLSPRVGRTPDLRHTARFHLRDRGNREPGLLPFEFAHDGLARLLRSAGSSKSALLNTSQRGRFNNFGSNFSAPPRIECTCSTGSMSSSSAPYRRDAATGRVRDTCLRNWMPSPAPSAALFDQSRKTVMTQTSGRYRMHHAAGAVAGSERIVRHAARRGCGNGTDERGFARIRKPSTSTSASTFNSRSSRTSPGEPESPCAATGSWNS